MGGKKKMRPRTWKRTPLEDEMKVPRPHGDPRTNRPSYLVPSRRHARPRAGARGRAGAGLGSDRSPQAQSMLPRPSGSRSAISPVYLRRGARLGPCWLRERAADQTCRLAGRRSNRILSACPYKMRRNMCSLRSPRSALLFFALLCLLLIVGLRKTTEVLDYQLLQHLLVFF